MEWMVNDLMDDNACKACICGWVDLLEDEHMAVLYLAEKGIGKEFTKETMNKIFQG